ncbi:MAG: bacillithiol biosynthesis deacetylase BshB1 [Gemmatimonadetes bacterium]|nr:bacillithiol biosynthesis deacetylase BshB1 [Gemmatimonadota bacterium]
MPEPLDVLAVMAHPDDAELLCGGALAKSAARGERAGVLDLTRGESGSWGSAQVRARESERAAEILGLALRRNAGLPDASLENSLQARRTVVALLRELRPRVVVTHWTRGRHPDHTAAAALVREACFLAGLKNLEAPGQPWRPFKLVHATAFREDAPPPSFVVDISDWMERKMEALAAYGSQFEGRAAMGEVMPGGDRPVLEQVRVQCAHYGSLIRVAYAEPFHTAETMVAPTLGGLEVASF